MVSWLNSEASGLGSSPGREHCVVFLGKTLNSHSASLHPHVEMGTSKLIVMMEATLRLIGKSHADSR